MGTSLLPQLDAGVVVGLNPGQISEITGGISTVYNKMIIDNNVKKAVPHSVPSIFEKALQFYDAMKGRRDGWKELDYKYEQEWRVFVTMVALNDVLKLGLHFDEINFNTDKSRNTNSFINFCARDIAMSIEKPVDTFGNGWDKLYVITMKYDPEETMYVANDKVIGITSPYTLFCPSKDFQSIISHLELFSFAEFDSTHNNNNVVNLKEQFVLMENKDLRLKGVAEWLKKIIEKLPPNETVVKNLATRFLDTIKDIITDDLFSKTWNFDILRYREPAFGIEKGSPYAKCDFVVRSVENEEHVDNVWCAMFSALALNELKNLKVAVKEGSFYIDETLLAIPNEVTAFSPNLELLNERIVKDSLSRDNLSKFEKDCVVQWIIRFRKRAEETNKESGFFEIMNHYSKKCLALFGYNQTSNILEWNSNRFFDNAYGIEKSGDKKLFDFEIHAYNAVFFQADEDETVYTKNLKRTWFNMLKIIALSEIRKIPLQYSTFSANDAYGYFDSQGGLASDGEIRNYMGCKIEAFGSVIAYASRATLVHALSGETALKAVKKVYEILYKSVVPAMFSKQGRKNINEKRLARINEDFDVDDTLFDYEFILLNKWFGVLSDCLEKGDGNDGLTFLNKGSRDIEYIVNMIQEERKRLMDRIGSTTRTNYSEVEQYYKFNEPVIGDVLSIARVFAYKIHDDLFAEKLILIAKPNIRMGKQTQNTPDYDHRARGDLSVTVPVGVSESGSETPIDDFAVLPFTDGFMSALYNTCYSPNNLKRATQEIEVYGISCIKTYELDDFNEQHVFIKGIVVPIIKIFGEEDTIRIADSEAIPQISIWPDVEIANWNEYYLTYINWSGRTQGEHITIETPGFIASSVPVTNQVVSNHSFMFQVRTVNRFPRIIKLSYENSSGQYTGFLVIQPDPMYSDANINIPCYIKPIGGKKVVAGIDFGTTNTTAYIKDLQDDAKQFSVYAAMSQIPLRIIEPSSKELIIAATQKTGRTAAEFNTALLTYNRAADDNSLPSGVPFMDANIYHMMGIEGIGKEGVDVTMSPDFKTNLKWDVDGSGASSKDLTAFFTQISIQCCVMAIKKYQAEEIEFRFSFPTSMPLTKKQQVETTWTSVLANVSNISGLKITNNTKKRFYPESHVSGLAFMEGINQMNVNAAFTQGFVCVDIGGGSTDISFWQDKNLGNITSRHKVDDFLSVAFAGRTLLQGKAVSPSVFEKVHKQLSSLPAEKAAMDKFKDTSKRASMTQEELHIAILATSTQVFITKLSEADISRKEFLTDCVIARLSKRFELSRQSGQNFSINILTHIIRDRQNNDDVMQYLAYIKFTACGLCYFIGNVLGKLYKEKRFEFRNDEIDIYLAGNGSRVFDWIVYNEDNAQFIDNPSPLLAEYVRDGIKVFAGAEHDDIVNKLKVNVHRSEKPKKETAYGLVYADADAVGFENMETADSIAPVNVEKIFTEQIADSAFFSTLSKTLKSTLNAGVFTNEEVSKVSGMSKEDAVEFVTKKINPDYNTDKIIDLIGEFVISFRRNSPKDFPFVFPPSYNDIYEGEKINTEGNKNLRESLSRICMNLIAPAKKGEPVFPIRDFNGYAVLKYIKSSIR